MDGEIRLHLRSAALYNGERPRTNVETEMPSAVLDGGIGSIYQCLSEMADTWQKEGRRIESADIRHCTWCLFVFLGRNYDGNY